MTKRPAGGCCHFPPPQAGLKPASTGTVGVCCEAGWLVGGVAGGWQTVAGDKPPRYIDFGVGHRFFALTSFRVALVRGFSPRIGVRGMPSTAESDECGRRDSPSPRIAEYRAGSSILSHRGRGG